MELSLHTSQTKWTPTTVACSLHGAVVRVDPASMMVNPVPPKRAADDGEDWPDDYTPAEGRHSTKWPEDWSREQIEEEAKVCVEQYVDDWGWELHKHARLNNEFRLKKTLRYEIHLEAFDGYGRCAQVLNWQDPDFGQTALWWTALHGNLDMAEVLIRAGADVDLADKDGWVPLSVAAFYGHVDVVKALLSAGADPSKEVEDGDTAYEKAVAWDHPECAVLLKGVPAHPLRVCGAWRLAGSVCAC